MMLRVCLGIMVCAGMAQAQVPDTPFWQETRRVFTYSDGFTRSPGLPSDNVLAITLAPDGRPVVATDRGMTRWDIAFWKKMADPDFVPTWLLSDNQHLYAITTDSAAVLRRGTWETLPVASPVTAVFASPQHAGLLVAQGTQLLLFAGDDAPAELQPVATAPESVLSLAQGPAAQLVIGTENGLYAQSSAESSWDSLLPADTRYRWAPRDVRALTFDQQGQLWFGCQQGAGVRRTDGSWDLFTGAEGLPWNHFSGVTAGADGAIWFATDKGAIRRENDRFRYRFSRRWVPADQINGIAVAKDGTAWLATPGGVGRIDRQSLTLKDKAALMTQQVEQRHVRDGYVATSPLREAWNPDSYAHGITDNDGLYTSMYGAAQAFRFAATGDEEARQLARRSFLACKRLVDITGNGFVARVIIPADWHEDVNQQYGHEYNVSKRKRDPHWKLITPRFPLSKDGKYRYKVDTSSDELAGHYFFYPIYYDLVAETEEEKQLVRDVMRSMTDHLIENGFVLRDHDGEPTRWGDFSPGYLNSMRGWAQRGLNSMMMLSFLRAAEHVTGDPKYGEVFDQLCAEHKYDFLAMKSKTYYPPEDVVPWDNNLCLMSWYNLLRYEPEPRRVLAWRLSMEHAWLHISKQKSAFWNFLFRACSQHVQELAKTDFFDGAYPEMTGYKDYLLSHYRHSDAQLQDSVEMLQNLPLDLIEVVMDNTHRLDVRFDNTPGAQETWLDRRGTYGWHFDGRALPIDERGHVRVDRDAFDLKLKEGGGKGHNEQEGTFYLLPYYLGLHHGFIE